MWPFDYFKKKREKEEQERRRAEEDARRQKLEQERVARERERRLEENRRKERERQERLKAEREKSSSSRSNEEMINKASLESIIKSLAKLSYMFRDSTLLSQVGRNTTMMSRLHSYTGMMGYLYEVDYKYGSFSGLVDDKIAQHYLLVKNAMSSPAHKNKSIAELADNWSDVLQVIFNLSLEASSDKSKFEAVSNEVDAITKVFEKLSGKKCKKPSDPRKVTPRNVTYNPLNITDDLQKSKGHVIPDITDVFAQELIPKMLYCLQSGKSPKDEVANYAISMIKSYYDNAGFVPMVIVDQITGQINQVTCRVQDISYSPYSSLKEYVLSKIYR